MAFAGVEQVYLDQYGSGALQVKAVVDGHGAVLDLATPIPATNQMVLPWAWKDNDRLRSEAASNVARAAIAGARRSGGLPVTRAPGRRGDRRPDPDPRQRPWGPPAVVAEIYRQGGRSRG